MARGPGARAEGEQKLEQKRKGDRSSSRNRTGINSIQEQSGKEGRSGKGEQEREGGTGAGAGTGMGRSRSRKGRLEHE